MFEKATATQWARKPKTIGELYAKGQLDKAINIVSRYSQSAERAIVIKMSLDDSDDWRYWHKVSDDHIVKLRYVVLRIDRAHRSADVARSLQAYVNLHCRMFTPELVEYIKSL